MGQYLKKTWGGDTFCWGGGGTSKKNVFAHGHNVNDNEFATCGGGEWRNGGGGTPPLDYGPVCYRKSESTTFAVVPMASRRNYHVTTAPI